MPDLYLIVDIIVVVALIGLGVAVLVKNSTLALNRIFALFVGCIAIWIMANYISNVTSYAPVTATRANYFVFPFSYLASLFLLQFGIRLAGDARATRILHKAYIPLLLVGLCGATPLVVKGVELQGTVYAVKFGPLATLYFITLIVNLIAVTYVVKRNIARTHGDRRGRLIVLFRSLYWTFPVLALAQAVIPATTGWFGLTNVGILPMLILVFGLYYGVVKHRLFDLRLIILRAVVYVCTLTFLAAVYGLVTHYVTTKVVEWTGSSSVTDFINISLIVVVIIAYAPLKGTFKRITNRFFYQDAYDPQDLLNHLNRALVSTLEPQLLLQRSMDVMSSYLKLSYCLVSIRDDGRGYRLFGAQENQKLDKQVIAGIRKQIPRDNGSVIITDYLDEAHHGELQSLLQKYSIGAVARLHSSAQKDGDDLGYIIIGPKRSGSPYTRQDARVLDTIANELVIAVQNALRFEEIENFNTTLQGKIDDATRKLRRTNDKLRQLDETKDDFISMASHQLRTPLTSVKGYVSMVLDGDAGKITPLQRKLLNQAFISSQRMVYLIADLLNVSRLRTGKFIIEPTPTDLAQVVKDEVDQLVETAKGRNLELTYHKPEHFPVYMLDETKLRQVIMNFIDNAIYYTPSGGHITVKLENGPKSIEFQVIDDGIGVPKSEQHHLFSKFYRAHNAKQARPDGTGLGLFMAKKVVLAQGGATTFRSQPGKGSAFGFVFAKEHLHQPK